MEKIEVCALCGEKKILQKSHLVPKFMSEWVKRTSLTGKLRNSSKPNSRQQDGEKEKMLCFECEQRFSKREKVFSRDIFKRIIENEIKDGKIVTNDDIYFCVSVIWRCFTSTKSTIDLNQLSIKEQERIDLFLEECRKYLLDENDILNYNFYLIPTDKNMVDRNKIIKDIMLNERGSDLSDHKVCSMEEEGIDFHRFTVKTPFFIIRADLHSNTEYIEKGCLLKKGERILEYDKIELSKDISEYFQNVLNRIDRTGMRIRVDEKERIEKESKEKLNSDSRKDILKRYTYED